MCTLVLYQHTFMYVQCVLYELTGGSNFVNVMAVFFFFLLTKCSVIFLCSDALQRCEDLILVFAVSEGKEGDCKNNK